MHAITTFLLLILVPLLALRGHRCATEEISNVPRDSQADVKAALEKISRMEEQLEAYGDRLNSYTSLRKIRSSPENSEAAGVCDTTLIRSELSTLRSELKAKVPCVLSSDASSDRVAAQLIRKVLSNTMVLSSKRRPICCVSRETFSIMSLAEVVKMYCECVILTLIFLIETYPPYDIEIRGRSKYEEYTTEAKVEAKIGNVSTNLLNLKITIEEQAGIIKSLQDEVLSLKTRLSSVESTLPKNERWCPPSWSLFSNSCYVFIDMSLNWLDAQSLCRGFMGHLVEINSAEENKFVFNLISLKGVTEAWIGINDIVHDGNWVLITSGRPLSYTSWREGEPNNYLGIDEDCGAFRPYGQWNDVHCINYTYSSVCERSAFD